MPTSDFYIHKIRKNDTLNSVAKRLQIHPVDLKIFHNERCSQAERIYFDHLEGIEKLFVPINLNKNSLRQKEKSNERPNQYFNIQFYKNEYQITEIFTNENSEKLLISYNIQLVFEKIENNQFLLKFHQHDFRRNGKEVDEKLFNLANKTLRSISPISFTLNNEGKLIATHEAEKLVEKFKDHRQNIENDFIGDLVTNYLDLFEYNLLNKEYLLKQYTSTLLFQVLFINRQVFQTESIFQKEFYLLSNSFLVNCKCEAIYHHEEDQFVRTIIKGISVDHYGLDEILTGIKSDEIADNSTFHSLLNFEYKTNKRTKQLVEASAEIQLFDDDIHYQTYSLILKPIN